MADTTWSVRVDEETKQDVINLLNSSGEQGKEFIQSLMSAYKLKKAEELQPVATQDIKDLQIHLARVQDIYFNLSNRIDTRIKAKDTEVAETLEKKNLELETATIRVAELSNDVTQLRDLIEGCNNVIDNQTKKLTEQEDAISTTKALVSEYKEKNDMLAGLLAEYKEYKTEIDEMKATLEQEKNQRFFAEKDKNETLEQLEKLKLQHNEEIQKMETRFNEYVERLTLKHKDEVERMSLNHKDELERTKSSLMIEQKQHLLDVQSAHQEEVNKLHQHYNDQIQEIVLSFSHAKDGASPKE